MVLLDSHSHSKNSPDAIHSVTQMCERAISIGISHYTITDHVECNALHWDDEHPCGRAPYFRDIFEGSMKDIYTAKELYSDKIELLAGVELGEPCHCPEITAEYANDKRLDFIIGSIHQIRDHRDFFFLDYNKLSIPNLLDTYFKEIHETCLWNGADVIGHLTYTLRYMQGEQGHTVDLKPYEDIIRESFKILVQNGKGIEVNSSGIRQKYGEFFPSEYYVKMFKECGGEIITVGSDSHCTDDLAKGIPEAIEMIKHCGFKYVSYFKDRKPNLVTI